jgi:hypothetical protein
MMLARILLSALLLAAIPAAAQRPLFEPDDFIDPAYLDGPLFLSRVAAGGVSDLSNHYRPLHDDAGFVLITNSLYVDELQFDWKHLEFFDDDTAVRLQRCDCPEPVYFPTPPPGNATPAAPPAGRSDTLQVAFYRTSGRDSDTPSTLRYRAAYTVQLIDTVVTSVTSGHILERRSGYDQSFTLDADTHFQFAGRDVWGSLYFARASRSDAPYARTQNEFAYISRFPSWPAGPVLFRMKLTLGHVTGSGATGLNVINPYLEAYWRHDKSRVNFHVAWSPEHTRSGVGGWRTNHQLALFADYTLLVKAFTFTPRPRR